MVAMVTLMNPGGTRKFYIRDKSKGDQIVLKVPTRHNQLLVMGGDFQEHYKHELPCEKRNQNSERVSITARYHKK
jgi:alkylated DNA repair dioxygenase AlkB